jgi:hypothetical protein
LPGGLGVGVVVAKDVLLVGEDLGKHAMCSVIWPWLARISAGRARVLRASGWWSPRMCSWSART